MEQVIELLREH
jgi:hypothetical protein